MKTAAEFFEVFKRHGFLVAATHTSSTPPNTATPLDVHWTAPGEFVLEDVVTIDRAITFPASILAGVKAGDSFGISGATYIARFAMPKPGTDGSELLVGLRGPI